MNGAKDIPGWEGLYAITRAGRVWSHPRVRVRGGFDIPYKGRWRKPTITRYGYATTTFHKTGGGSNPKPYKFFVHRLVAITYLEPVNGKQFVNHKDGDKLNNHVSNLEWCTHQENARHALGMGLRTPPTGERHGMSRFTEDNIRAIRKLYSQGVKSPALAHKFKSSNGHILKIVNRELWKHVM
jgi:hypothetical protein